MTREEKLQEIFLYIYPAMIGDCDQLIEKGPDYFEDWTPILDLWIEKKEPIDCQPDKCIDYIYSLIRKDAKVQ